MLAAVDRPRRLSVALPRMALHLLQTGPANSIQAFSEQWTRFASGPPFPPEQLKSVPRHFDGAR
jgi:hypothetical protein